MRAKRTSPSTKEKEEPRHGRVPRPSSAPSKRRRLARDGGAGSSTADFFDGLPDDIVLIILRRLSCTASRPSDLLGVHLTCKRLRSLALHPLVLYRASAKSLAIPAAKWSETFHGFLRRCVEAGNLDACYMLGMIRFYCLGNRPGGMSLLARASMRHHPFSLYSLAIIQFNGSGCPGKSSKNLRAGVVLCARAASLGHVDALRELGHCLQDGYGVRRDVAKGRRFLVQANAREIAAALRGIPDGFARLLAVRKKLHQQLQSQTQQASAAAAAAAAAASMPPCPLMSDFGCNILPGLKPHPVNRFLNEWFSLESTGGGGAGGGMVVAAAAPSSSELRLCSHSACGRRETRRHEFRRCSVCGKANYCSRACQALDWRFRHRAECVPMPRWVPGQPVQPQAELPAGAGAAEAAA